MLVAVATLAGVACGDDGPIVAVVDDTTPASEPASSASPAAPAEVVEIQALDNTFSPKEIVVAPGTEVHFVNGGRNKHNAQSITDGEWGVADVDFRPGDDYTHVFDEPGEYRYFCSLHGTAEFGMFGVIVVDDEAG